MAQITHLHFIFTVEPIEQSAEFRDRTSGGAWLPPRPFGANVHTQGGAAARAYEYHAGRVQSARLPSSDWETFRAYSFYYTNGCILLYPGNATRQMVGDGSGNEPLTRGARQAMHDNAPSENVEDWRQLSFLFPANNDGSQTSQVRFRGPSLTVGVLRNDSVHVSTLRQLLPERYLPAGSAQYIPALQTSAQGILCGGLVGLLPILIALIAFSVPVQHVDWAVRNCFPGTYVPHGFTGHQGWITGRGMVVQVFCQSRARSGHLPPRQVLERFEQGTLPGYPKFVP